MTKEKKNLDNGVEENFEDVEVPVMIDEEVSNIKVKVHVKF